MSESGKKRVLGGPIDLIPMLPSTRKSMEFHFVQPGDHVPHKVIGGVMMEPTDEFGVVITGEGPFFLSESTLRSWVYQFEDSERQIEQDQHDIHLAGSEL